MYSGSALARQNVHNYQSYLILPMCKQELNYRYVNLMPDGKSNERAGAGVISNMTIIQLDTTFMASVCVR